MFLNFFQRFYNILRKLKFLYFSILNYRFPIDHRTIQKEKNMIFLLNMSHKR
ncbi:hypothetical protein Hanom_Chr16g01438251 [Helianthus anomalus]